ncbi:hypothetical protein SDC9_49241 [bioreactor metagenome]|uniref:Uncharacterized protein n=1 Tax=bioreactor metagenome TaxID=1076179 RepID=A0A644WGT8_9ZZZZ
MNTRYTNIIIDHALIKTDCCPSPGSNPIPLQLNQRALKQLRKRYNRLFLLLVSVIVLSSLVVSAPFCTLNAMKSIFIADLIMFVFTTMHLHLIRLDLRHQIAYPKRLFHQRIKIRILQYGSIIFILLSPAITCDRHAKRYMAFSMIRIG